MNGENVLKFELPKDRRTDAPEKDPLTAQEGQRLDFIGSIMTTYSYLDTLRVARPESGDPERVRACRDELSEYSNDNLKQALTSGTWTRWHAKPEWYYALITETLARDMVPAAVRPVIEGFIARLDDKTLG